MRTVGAFELDIDPETDMQPMKVKVVLMGAVPNEHGVISMTPECMSLDVLEGCINALQDELDVIRAEARRAFTNRTAGTA
jgi:hypothetical protein